MSPFREIEHTADWALQVWAPTLEALFVDAAQGMYALAGAQPGGDEVTVRLQFEVRADDYESLLVAWLQELLYHTESRELVFDSYRIDELTATRLRAEASGARAARLDKVIKAVTYHNIKIEQTAQGYEVTIVFDV